MLFALLDIVVVVFDAEQECHDRAGQPAAQREHEDDQHGPAAFVDHRQRREDNG